MDDMTRRMYWIRLSFEDGVNNNMKLTKKLWGILALLALWLLLPAPVHAQYSPIQGWCEDGNEAVVTSGLDSTNPVQASHPLCTVTVVIHGAGSATIYSTS